MKALSHSIKYIRTNSSRTLFSFADISSELSFEEMFKFATAVRQYLKNFKKITQLHISIVFFQIVAFGVFAYCNGTPHQKRSSLFDLGPWDRVSTQTHIPVISTSSLGNKIEILNKRNIIVYSSSLYFFY